MFDKFSEMARLVIFWGRYEAGGLGFAEIDTCHLLLGFIHVDSGSGNRSLAGIVEPVHESFLNERTAQALRSYFSSPGPRSQPVEMHGDMPLSERAKQVITDAVGFVEDGQVTQLHLLWAMLSNEQGEVAVALTEAGITREQIKQQIRERHLG